MQQSANHISTILIVDRDPDDCLLFKEALTEVAPRTKVIFREGAASLLDFMEQVQPSLIFIAYRLPGDSGVEWVRQLKSHPVFHSVPVIMWSTGSAETFRKEAYDVGVQLYLEKPWEINLWTEQAGAVVEQYLPLMPALSLPAPAATSTGLRKVGLSCPKKGVSPLVQNLFVRTRNNRQTAAMPGPYRVISLRNRIIDSFNLPDLTNKAVEYPIARSIKLLRQYLKTCLSISLNF